ncbi:MAG: hypothetical protein KDG52_02620 [Rhodocyclaceae bacterium]|nr:hypothetical protein [Rhodocyclaceae bacterium]
MTTRYQILAIAIVIAASTSMAADDDARPLRTPPLETAGKPKPEPGSTRRGGPTLCECLNEPGDDPKTVAHCDGMLASLEMAAIARARAKCGEQAAGPHPADVK